MSADPREGIDADQVAAWLRRHPRFLEQFSDLAQSLVVPRDSGQATSLASYQLDVLRDKNRELNRRLHELFANAEENERLVQRTHRLTLTLMRQRSAADTLRAMVASLREDFDGELVRVVLYAPVPGLEADADWLITIARDAAALSPFAPFLATGEALCGRLQPEKMDLLFGDAQSDVGSVALLPLDPIGMLAVGSRDGSRFYPGMGTLFLRLMSEALVVAMGRFGADE
ncbi:DUF484 family protein [Alkalisalibacterium limincola]|jgi:uncharacterized protein|uniref:DUF484 family protein n=1 Tax=Alkalisalibacterium limincola TaxID=2699169 RepID=A0A5C8KZA1_9GAMM|nr:DUF484 family protein [Alkalisalibacterium limincola]TXK64845.1 DUF484 family protein [Alkalisalibacterium limincola]